MRPIKRSLMMLGAAAMIAVTAACGGSGAAGTYTHPEEGTIVLEDDGTATWTQSGDPAEFEWSEDGDELTFDFGSKKGNPRIEDGNLVMPPDMISGDEDVVFEKE